MPKNSNQYYSTPLTTPVANPASTYLEVASRYDTSLGYSAVFSKSTLATPVIPPYGITYSSATGKLLINVGTAAVPVLRTISTS